MVDYGGARDAESFLRLVPYWGNSARMVAHMHGPSATQEQLNNAIFCDATLDWWATITCARRVRDSERLADAEWQALLGLLRARHREHWGVIAAVPLDE